MNHFFYRNFCQRGREHTLPTLSIKILLTDYTFSIKEKSKVPRSWRPVPTQVFITCKRYLKIKLIPRFAITEKLLAECIRHHNVVIIRRWLVCCHKSSSPLWV